MKTLNDILSKLKFDRESNPIDAHEQVLNLLAVSGWLEIKGNESVFNEYAKFNCLCKFDNNTECRYNDEHPMAVMTHFRCK